MFSVIFAGTSDFSVECLKCLLEMESVQVKGALTVPDRPGGRGMKQKPSPVKSFAARRRLRVWTPKTLTGADFLKAISSKECSLSVVCAYGKWLPNAFLDCFSMESVNIHPSLLPRWRGAAPIERALMAGDRETGVSLQKIAAEMDAGDIIGRKAFPVEKEDSAENVYQKAVIASRQLLREDLLKYLRGEIQALPQSVYLEEAGEKKAGISYAAKVEKKEAKISWNQSALSLHNKIRALALGPQAFTFFRGKRLKIHRARPIKAPVQFSGKNPSPQKKPPPRPADFSGQPSPGAALSEGGKRLFVFCGEGILEILELQREGKTKQKAAAFLKGAAIQAGDIFG